MTERDEPDDAATRLRSIENEYDSRTTAILDALGVAPGWRCMEVGGGAGSIATALQQRAGAVILVEKDARHVQHLASPSFTIVEAPLETATMPSELDLVHTRFLLDIVEDPQSAVARLVGCLRAGGWLFLEEFDFSTLRLSSGSQRARELHDAVTAAAMPVLESIGHHVELGRSLPSLLLELGLVDVETTCECAVRHAGTARALDWQHVVVDMEDDLLRGGLPEADLTEYVELLSGPGFSYFSPLVVRTWGRAPG